MQLFPDCLPVFFVYNEPGAKLGIGEILQRDEIGVVFFLFEIMGNINNKGVIGDIADYDEVLHSCSQSIMLSNLVSILIESRAAL